MGLPIDTTAILLARGRAAEDELSKLKTIISYWLQVEPEMGDVLIRISRSAQLSAKSFEEMVFKHAKISKGVK